MESDPRKDTSVFVCYAGEDNEYARQLTRDIADLGFTVHDVALTLWEAYRKKAEEAIQQSDYYIIIFSPAFFEERFAHEQLNALFDAYVFKTGRGRKVLPVVLRMEWNDLREKSPLFGTMRPMDGGETDKARKRLAELFYKVVVKDYLPLPTSSKLWQWEDKIEKLIGKTHDGSVVFPPVRELQMVENGKFSIVLVTDSMPDQSPENTGDLIVEVDGKSLKTLKPEELNLIVQRFQSNTDHPQSVKVQKRKLTGKHMYMNMVQKHPTSNKKTTEKKTPGEELRTSEKKLWKGPLEHYEVKKKNGQFGLKLMKIKDPSSRHHLPVIMRSFESGLFHGELIVAVNETSMSDYKKTVKELKSFPEGEQISLLIQRPNKKELDDYINEMYTEDGGAESSSAESSGDSAVDCEDREDDSTQVEHQWNDNKDRTAIVGTEQRQLILPDMQKLSMCVAQGSKTKPIDCQPEESKIKGKVVVNPCADIKDKRKDDQAILETEGKMAPVANAVQVSATSEEPQTLAVVHQPKDLKTKTKVVVNPSADVREKRKDNQAPIAVVETEGKMVPVANAVQVSTVDEEPQTTGVGHQVQDTEVGVVQDEDRKVKVVLNPSADPRDEYGGDSRGETASEFQLRRDFRSTDVEVKQLRAVTETNAATTAPAGDGHEQAHDHEHDSWVADLTVPKQGWYKQLVSFVSKTQTGCGEQKMAEDLLRPNWTKLVNQLDAETAADKLYEQRIISFDDMENIHKAERKSRRLLKLMKSRPWMDGVQFAKIVTQIDRNCELGQRLLLSAGLEVVGKSTSTAPVDRDTVVLDLRSMIESVVESKTQENFKQLHEMMIEIADSLSEK